MAIYLCFYNRKAEFVKDNGYGGVIIWEIGIDDIKKECCTTDYPLLRAINYGLFGKGNNPNEYGCDNSSINISTTTESPTTPTTEGHSTEGPTTEGPTTPPSTGGTFNLKPGYYLLISLIIFF